MGNFTLELTIMQNNTVNICIPEQKLKAESLTSDQLLENLPRFDKEVRKNVEKVYLKLAEMHQLI